MLFAAGQRLTAGVLNMAVTHEVRKANTQSVTASTALVDDLELFFDGDANGVYTVGCDIFYDGTGDLGTGQGGLKLQFTGPAGATFLWSNRGTTAGVAPTLVNYNVVAEPIAAGSPRIVGTNSGTPMSCFPTGTLVMGNTAGRVRLRWAQGTSNATATRVLANSLLRYKRIA